MLPILMLMDSNQKTITVALQTSGLQGWIASKMTVELWTLVGWGGMSREVDLC